MRESGVGSELPCGSSSSSSVSPHAGGAASSGEEPGKGAPPDAYEVVGPDPGPLARLEHVKAQPDTAGVVFQRLCERETLAQIARAWGLPKGQFVLWFVTEHAELYDQALKVLAADLAHDAVEIADTPKPGVIRKTKADGTVEVTEDDMLGHRKLQVETRLKLAAKWDRKRYGEDQEAVRTVPVVLQIANLRGDTTVNVLEAPPPK